MTSVHTHTARARLPRYRRVPHGARLVLTARDLEILRITHAYRLVTSAHLQALTEGSDQGVLRRLQKLFHAGLLDRVTRRIRQREGSARMVYAITNRGLRELQKEGLIEQPTKTDWNAQNRDLHGYSIEHTLLISQCRAVLDCACRVTPNLKLLTWQEGPKTFDAVEVALTGCYARVPVAPDAFFGIEDPKGRLYFFLEADRGTMTVSRFTRKLAGYATYWREHRHEQKFGIRYFRVLTVTTGRKRRDNLLTAARNADCLYGLGRLFLFTDEASVTLERPQSILGKIWTTPEDEHPQALLGIESSGSIDKEDAWNTHS